MKNVGRLHPQNRFGIDSKVKVQRLGLIVESPILLQTWHRVGNQLSQIANSSSWWLGDWLVYGENNFPDRYRKAVEGTSLDYQTLRNYAWVARSFSLSRRRDDLSFAHHMEVAAMTIQHQENWLDLARQHGWSRNELRRQIRMSKMVASNPPLVPVVFKVAATAEQKVRWRKAANELSFRLESWVIDTLDKASSEVLSSSGVNVRVVTPSGDPEAI